MRLNPTPNQVKRFEESLSTKIDDHVSNFMTFIDGFSFTTVTELGAYKAAYAHRHYADTTVAYAPNVALWTVQVYTERS